MELEQTIVHAKSPQQMSDEYQSLKANSQPELIQIFGLEGIKCVTMAVFISKAHKLFTVNKY